MGLRGAEPSRREGTVEQHSPGEAKGGSKGDSASRQRPAAAEKTNTPSVTSAKSELPAADRGSERGATSAEARLNATEAVPGGAAGNGTRGVAARSAAVTEGTNGTCTASGPGGDAGVPLGAHPRAGTGTAAAEEESRPREDTAAESGEAGDDEGAALLQVGNPSLQRAPS